MKEQGDRLKALRLKKRLTLLDVAEALGVSSSTISRYESGYIETMKTPTIKKLAELYGTTPFYIMGLDLEKDSNITMMKTVKQVPILGTICAGDGIWCEENYEGKFIIDPTITNVDFIVNVSGDSMSGDGIKDGDKAFIRSTSFVDNGKIAAILLNDTNEVMLKRIFVKTDHAVLQPSNPDFEPIVATNFMILGELVGVYHNMQ